MNLIYNMKNTLTIIALLILNYSCNNTAPKTDSASTIDPNKTSDSSAIVIQDTATKTSFSQTKFTPPPPPRVVDIPTISEVEMDEEAPPIIETNVHPNFQTNDAPMAAIDDNTPEIDAKIYTVVDQMPEMYMFKEFLSDNLIYPKTALNKGYQGVSIIGFVVDIYGGVKDVKTTKTSGNNELDMEAVRVIRKTSGKWKPGRINGKAVKTQMNVPITFEIDE